MADADDKMGPPSVAGGLRKAIEHGIVKVTNAQRATILVQNVVSKAIPSPKFPEPQGVGLLDSRCTPENAMRGPQQPEDVGACACANDNLPNGSGINRLPLFRLAV